ncbi:Uu.00g094790.m01.CDS01 [Anthostomella pinea]|uniref:Uu.00g094790.m01.CDS01 n=1 Tax=Anthostomella pinea TaxID=933095 RepID=A0AAI8VNT3_9PEZI|nr:Uu.00g094790.m01.CDS01 [Anthostomella pinea]
MRQIPHPVVVITTLDNTYRQQLDSNTPLEDKDLKRPVPRAMTVSSMTSLCIKPIPRVAFNVTLPSTTYNAIRSCGVFNVHILAGSEHGARVADLFTRGNYRRVDAQAAGPDGGVFEGLMELDVQVQGRDAWEQEFDQEATGRPLCNRDDPLDAVMSVPLLQGKGIMHVLRCTLYRRADEIDQNAIVVGDVRDIVAGEQAPEGAHALVYVDRAYRRIGEPLLDRSPVADKAIRPEEPVEAGGVEGSGRQTNGNNG